MPRVALTSTSDRIPRLAEMVSKHGLEPVGLPCIEVIPAEEELLARARAEAVEADLVLITSRRAVEVVWPAGGMPETPVAVVGAATQRAVEEAGGRAMIVGEGGVSDLMMELQTEVSNRRVLFPHASGADPTTVERLDRMDALVSALAVYETRSVSPPDGSVDAVIFGSPSAVEGWCQSRSLEGPVLAVMGETTRSAVIDRGYHPHVMPPRPDFELLAALLSDHFRERSSV